MLDDESKISTQDLSEVQAAIDADPEMADTQNLSDLPRTIEAASDVEVTEPDLPTATPVEEASGQRLWRIGVMVTILLFIYAGTYFLHFFGENSFSIGGEDLTGERHPEAGMVVFSRTSANTHLFLRGFYAPLVYLTSGWKQVPNRAGYENLMKWGRITDDGYEAERSDTDIMDVLGTPGPE